MAINQPMSEAEEKAIDTLLLTVRVNKDLRSFESGQKSQIDILKEKGFDEAAKYLEMRNTIPF